MLLAVVAGFVLGLLAPLLVRAARTQAGWLISLLPLGLFAYFAHLLPEIGGGNRLFYRYDWLPDLGIRLSFCVDGLSLLFALLITGVGAIVCVYSGGYLSGHRDLGKFYVCLLAFMASMLGVVLTDNLVGLVVFWELTSITSYLLIGFEHHRQAARHAALQALLVTGLGGLTLLAAFLILEPLAGTFEMSALVEMAPRIKASPHYPTVLALVLIGAATKSAQVPFHFWLPNAMEAPAPVSTYLHAATMVKAGVYLLARLVPILGGTDLWRDLVTPLGGVTMVTGAWMAFFQTDLKRILAYTTVSALGIFVFLIGQGTAASLYACMAFLTAHGLYKGGLFLGAGIIDHEAGTREAVDLGGLRRAMPLTCIATLLAVLSSAGVPPFFGFLGKELLYEVTLQASHPAWLTAPAVFVSILFAAMGGVVGIRPFFRREVRLPKTPHDPPVSLWIGPMALGLLGLFFGMAPDWLHSTLLAPAASASAGAAVEAQRFEWHGFDLKIALGTLGLIVGGLAFWKWEALTGLASGVRRLGRLGPAACYEFSLRALESCARTLTRLAQSGHLNVYLLTVLVTATGLLAWALARDGLTLEGLELHRWTDLRAYEAIMAAILLVATVAVVRAPSRLVAIVALGVVGYGTALIFLFFSAPDLAMTQFAIETLSVILLVLVLFKLPKYQSFSTRGSRLRDAVVALSAGAVATLLVLAVTAIDRSSRLVSFFADHSLSLARGRNVVNVILVDFRGFDTLGEITVLAAAAIGVYALVRLIPGGSDGREGSR